MIDWNEIKQLLETVGSVAVLDQDGSKFIVLSHDNYLRLLDKDREETGVRLNFFPPGLKNGLSVQKTEAQETIEKLCSIVRSAGLEDFSFIRDIENFQKVFQHDRPAGGQ